MNKFFKTALCAAEVSSQILRAGFFKKIKVTDKGGKAVSDLVTQFDYAAQKAILKIIVKAFPDHSLLSEEGISILKKSDYQWIIDPLDGTNNFSRGIPNFSTSIALSRKGELLLGVTTLPAQNEIYWATAGGGAFQNGKRISVSKNKELRSALVGISMLRSREALSLGSRTFKKLLSIPIKPRIFGSIATDLARVASGKLDAVVFNHSMPWDIAAGILLVEEAGGTVSGIGKFPNLLKSKQLIASNRHLHSGLLKKLQK